MEHIITRTPRLALAALTTIAVGLACYHDDTPTAPRGRSLAKVLLTDAPFPYDSVRSVNVHVVSIAASTAADTSDRGGQQWVTIAEPRRAFDLLQLQRGTTALLGEAELPAGLYRAVRMTVNSDRSSSYTATALTPTSAGGSPAPSRSTPWLRRR